MPEDNTKPPAKPDMSMSALVAQVAKTGPVELRDINAEIIPEGKTQICLFRSQEIRQILHNDEWWYSIIDVVGVLSQSKDPSRYWSELKKKMSDESADSQLFDNIEQLKMPGKDGKMYATDCANAETFFRIVQSIPSPNAEPFKKWLARTAYERVLEIQNPEIAVKRAIVNYQLLGRDIDWIKNRLQTVIARNELTEEWRDRGVQEGLEFAMLTDTISQGTFDKTTKQHREYKGLGRSHNLRDHMTGLELVLTMLGEEATKEIAVKTDARGFYQNKEAAKAGGAAAGAARKSIELQTRKPVVSRQNFLTNTKRREIPEK
jgi:DNA-damage-inducible protein D